MKKRVMILYAKTGGGHRSLALAMAERLQHDETIEVILYNPFPKSVENVYEWFGGPLRFLWGVIWYCTDNAYLRWIVSFPSKLFVYPSLEKKCREIQPDLILSNHPLLCDGLRKVLQNASCPHTKIVIHVADPFTPHSVWFSSKDVDMFLLPTEQIKKLAHAYGISSSACEVIGWVLRSQFLNQRDAISYASKLPHIFIGSGGQGGGNTLELMKEIMDHSTLLQSYECVISVGSNKLLERALHVYKDFKKEKNIHIIPSTDRIDEYMRGACFVVGKLGPNFLFESLALEKPIVVTSYIPGQEDGNVAFVQKEKLGWIELTTKKAFDRIHQLLLSKDWTVMKTQIEREKKVCISTDEHQIHALIEKLIQ